MLVFLRDVGLIVCTPASLSSLFCKSVFFFSELFSYWFCCGSLLPCFGVRVSVTFHLTCVHVYFSSVLVAEWPPFGK